MPKNRKKPKKAAHRFNEYAMQVLHLIRTEGPISRRELAIRTGLNRSTLSEVVVRLLGQSLIHEGDNYKSVEGRRFRTLELNGPGRVVVGIEFTGDKTHALVANLACEVLWREDRPMPRGSSKEDIMACIEAAIGAALREAHRTGQKVIGIGHADVGLVDVAEERVVFSSAAPNWREVPLKKTLAAKFDLPVFVQNVGNTMVLAEAWWGAGKGMRDVLFVYLGTGIGLALCHDGKVIGGATNCLGELGHTIIDKDGPMCECGGRGCLEAIAGGEAILRRIKECMESGVRSVLADSPKYNPRRLGLDDVVRAAGEGDKLCTTVLGEASEYLAIGVVTAVNLFNPDIVVFGGTLAQSRELVVDTVRRAVKTRGLSSSVSDLKMEISAFGDDGPALGAATLAIRDYLSKAVLEDVPGEKQPAEAAAMN